MKVPDNIRASFKVLTTYLNVTECILIMFSNNKIIKFGFSNRI